MPSDRERANQAVEQFKVLGLNFGYECISNSAVRAEYIRMIKEMSDDMLKAYESGLHSAEETAKLAHEARNKILESARAKQTTLGKAVSRSMKEEGKALEELLEHYAKRKYQKALNQLDNLQREQVFVEIIRASGRARQSATTLARRLKWGGRAFWVFTIGVSLYNIGSSENKAWATGREVTTLGGGFGGGAAGGAIAGIWFGPIGIAVGVAVGGILGSLLAEEAYVEFAGPEREEARSILSKHTAMFSSDEEGIAKSLFKTSGINMDEVYVVFLELDSNYSGDADDVAFHYVTLVKENGGSLLHALRLHKPLQNLLIRVLDEGWTTAEEYQTIDYLKQLQAQ